MVVILSFNVINDHVTQGKVLEGTKSVYLFDYSCHLCIFIIKSSTEYRGVVTTSASPAAFRNLLFVVVFKSVANLAATYGQRQLTL